MAEQQEQRHNEEFLEGGCMEKYGRERCQGKKTYHPDLGDMQPHDVSRSLVVEHLSRDGFDGGLVVYKLHIDKMLQAFVSIEQRFRARGKLRRERRRT